MAAQRPDHGRRRPGPCHRRRVPARARLRPAGLRRRRAVRHARDQPRPGARPDRHRAAGRTRRLRPRPGDLRHRPLRPRGGGRARPGWPTSSCPRAELDAAVKDLTAALLAAPRDAVIETKALLRSAAGIPAPASSSPPSAPRRPAGSATWPTSGGQPAPPRGPGSARRCPPPRSPGRPCRPGVRRSPPGGCPCAAGCGVSRGMLGCPCAGRGHVFQALGVPPDGVRGRNRATSHGGGAPGPRAQPLRRCRRTSRRWSAERAVPRAPLTGCRPTRRHAALPRGRAGAQGSVRHHDVAVTGRALPRAPPGHRGTLPRHVQGRGPRPDRDLELNEPRRPLGRLVSRTRTPAPSPASRRVSRSTPGTARAAAPTASAVPCTSRAPDGPAVRPFVPPRRPPAGGVGRPAAPSPADPPLPPPAPARRPRPPAWPAARSATSGSGSSAAASKSASTRSGRCGRAPTRRRRGHRRRHAPSPSAPSGPRRAPPDLAQPHPGQPRTRPAAAPVPPRVR